MRLANKEKWKNKQQKEENNLIRKASECLERRRIIGSETIKHQTSYERKQKQKCEERDIFLKTSSAAEMSSNG